jgi:hypothetical protein
MSLLSHWKIGAAAALLGGMATVFLSPGPAVPIHDAIAAGPGAPSVMLQGRILILRPNWFLLRDSTGAVILETCPVWYRWLPLRPGEQVSVEGELAPRGCWRMGRPVFIVHRLRRENGVRISLRDGEGMPPWYHEIWRADIAISN